MVLTITNLEGGEKMSEATHEDRDLYTICKLEIVRLEEEILHLEGQDRESIGKRPKKGTVYSGMTDVLAYHIATDRYSKLVVDIMEKVRRGRILQIEHLEVRLHDFRTILGSLNICPVCEGYGYDNSPRPVSEGPDPHIPPCHKCGGSGTKTGIKKEEERVASIPKCDFSDFCSNHDEGTLI